MSNNVGASSNRLLRVQLAVFNEGVANTLLNNFNDVDAGEWKRINGNTTEISQSAGTVDDSTFGDRNDSNQRTLIQWSLTANAVNKGYAGFQTVVMKAVKTATSSTLALVKDTSDSTGKTWSMKLDTDNDNSDTDVRRMLDYNQATKIVTDIEATGVKIDTIDFFRGDFTTIADATDSFTDVSNSIALPTLEFVEVAKANSLNLTQSTSTSSAADFETSRLTGRDVLFPTSNQASIELGKIHTTASADADNTELVDGETSAYFIRPHGRSGFGFYGFFQVNEARDASSRSEVNTNNVTLNLNRPDINKLRHSFRWYYDLFAGTDGFEINPAMQIVLDAWQDQGCFWVASKPDADRPEGRGGLVIVSSANFTADVNSVGTFDMTFEGASDLFKLNTAEGSEDTFASNS